MSRENLQIIQIFQELCGSAEINLVLYCFYWVSCCTIMQCIYDAAMRQSAVEWFEKGEKVCRRSEELS